MKKILVVDDEKDILEIITEYAQNEGYYVLKADNGTEAIKLFGEQNIDIIVLDIMLPDFDGYEVAEKIKEIKNVPIIMLSAKNQEEDKLKGFDIGIVDYVTKPFSPRELMARIKVNLLKSENSIKSEEFCFEGVKINRTSKKVCVDNKPINLTIKEYELLNYLTQNKNILLTREQILDKVWGFDFFGTDRTIDTHIKSLRKKLGKYRNHIVTLRGAGYRFEE